MSIKYIQEIQSEYISYLSTLDNQIAWIESQLTAPIPIQEQIPLEADLADLKTQYGYIQGLLNELSQVSRRAEQVETKLDELQPEIIKVRDRVTWLEEQLDGILPTPERITFEKALAEKQTAYERLYKEAISLNENYQEIMYSITELPSVADIKIDIDQILDDAEEETEKAEEDIEEDTDEAAKPSLGEQLNIVNDIIVDMGEFGVNVVNKVTDIGIDAMGLVLSGAITGMGNVLSKSIGVMGEAFVQGMASSIMDGIDESGKRLSGYVENAIIKE